MDSLHMGNVIALSGVALSSYLIVVIVYRVFLHPLARIPGPKLAAITRWYETYYDVFKSPGGGQYVFLLEECHEEYGPILRINPNEVQIYDADFFDKVYASGTAKRWRPAGSQRGNASPGAMSSAESPDLHRLRRSAVHNFFSKSAILRLESRIQSRVQLLMSRLQQVLKQEAVIQAGTAFGALTLDIITEYSFGESWGCLDAEDMNEHVLDVMREGFATIQMRKHFPILSMLPKVILEKIPAAATVFAWQAKIRSDVLRVREARRADGKTMGNKQTIFSEILDSKLPPHEKETTRIADEALILVIAGTETTARVLSNLLYYLHTNSSCLARLREELDSAMPDPRAGYPLSKIEALPYLSGCLKEAMRTSAGGFNRSLFYADQPLQYRQYTLPPGTHMCVSFRACLHNKEIYPEPGTFNPDRWLGDSEAVKLANKYFHPFSKGARNCIGQNLSWAEQYLVAAHLFRRFELELYEVDFERDVKLVRDCFVGLPSLGSKGIRFRVMGERP